MSRCSHSASSLPDGAVFYMNPGRLYSGLAIIRSHVRELCSEYVRSWSFDVATESDISEESGIYRRHESALRDVEASAIAVRRVTNEARRDTRVKVRKGRKATRLEAARCEMIVGYPRLPMNSSFDGSTPGFFRSPNVKYL